MNHDEEQRILRMRVALQKAENMLSVFYTDLDVQRNLIGDENLADWCLFKLERSFDQINLLTNALKKNDALRVRQELSKVKEQQRLAKFEKERIELDRQLELARRKAELGKLKRRTVTRRISKNPNSSVNGSVNGSSSARQRI